MTKAVATIRKPSLSPITNSGQAVDAINKLTQAVQLFSGQHNDKLERAVTFKDLLRSGYDVSGLSTGGGTIAPPAVPEQNPDMSVPPPIRNFRLEVTLSQLLCFWDPAGYRNHAYVELWIAAATKKVGTVAVPTVLSDGHFYGTCPTTAIGVSGLPEDSIRVWARNVSLAGIPGPWHNEAGSVGTIPANPSYLIDKISGEIRQGDLYPALGSKITDTEARSITNATSLVNHDFLLGTHGTELVQHGTVLAQHGTQLDTANASISSLQTLSTSQGNTIATMQTTLTSHGGSITNIQQVNSSQNSTIATMQTTLSSHGTSITNIQQINTNQDTTIATHGTLLNSHGSSITSIQQINTNQDTTIASHGTLLSSHGSSITSIQQINTNQDTTIASHSTTLSSHGSSITSIQQINTNQDTTIASQGTLLSSHSSSIASLNSITTSHGNTLTSHGTTLSSYGTRISTQETINTSQGALVNAAYTLRIDSGGSVSGFGLMVDGATNRSQFIIRADQFAIAAPQAYDVNGAPIVQTAAFPFIVDVTNVNDPKVLIKNAYISTAYIETLIAGKVNADYVNAMSLNAIKITGGQITIGNNFSVDVYGNMTCANAFFKGTAQSSNFVSGSAGWRLLNTGDAELNNAVVRGTVYANAGWFKGTVYAEKLVGGAYTRKVYQSDTVADFAGSNAAASAWYTAKRVTVSRGMTVARVIDISGAYAHYTVATEHVGGSLPATFTATVKVGVRILRDGAYVAASTVVEIGLSDTIGAGSMATFVGGVGANLLATVPSDGATHYYDLQFRRELYGLVTSGVNASMTLGSNSSDSATAIMYIESGDLT